MRYRHPDKTIHPQGIGKLPAIPAGDLKVGDILSWNNAPDACTITRIVRETEKSIWIIERERKTGKDYKRRLPKKRLVAARRSSQ
ncbi:hypothetical protein BXY39_2559 [Eilatimonas milleporae]|uniref:Uncharacterized protein n=1 Tax=Eilatimonas milleporae TaxID=911205 RepID=A0A3M0C584_9PROT|nr:hypothetical protein BXY39_2559 [Eilatimonas milleporae]